MLSLTLRVIVLACRKNNKEEVRKERGLHIVRENKFLELGLEEIFGKQVGQGFAAVVLLLVVGEVFEGPEIKTKQTMSGRFTNQIREKKR